MDAGSWHRWRRPPPTPAEQRQDVLLALAMLAAAAVITVLVNSMGAFVLGPAPPLLEQFAWNVALAVPLVVRRRYPLAVLIVVGVLYLVIRWRQTGDTFVPSVVLFLAMYTAGAWERNRTVARWSRIGVIVGMFAWLSVTLVDYLVQPPPFEDAAGPLDPVLAAVLYDIVFNLLYFLSAYFFGNLAWLSARRKAELEHSTAELHRSQERNTHGAIVAERVRIARDLHDVVAHHVSVMGVQAGAARRVLDTDPELSRAALKTVEETARTAIGELRGLLGVLRAEDQPADENVSLSGTPGLDQLDELVSTARSTGLRVEHGVYGEPRPVPDAVALSAYRVVQEALTNVVRHAGAHSADVRVRYLANALEIEITDDGRGAGTHDSGFGLLGMRERVAVHGGELEAGPRRGTGYRVRASLPIEEKT
jgi:signal transduction histidine kinase